MSSVIDVINARCSTRKLIEPGPGDHELHEMFRAAAAAPDHGRCRPWRFITVPSRHFDDFGALLEKAYVRRCLESGDAVDSARRARERAKIRRAPALVIVACQPRTDVNIPVSEQLVAVAAATQNLLLCATSMGYGSMWRTGSAAADPGLKEALKLGPDDSVVGFIYLGTVPPGQAPPARGQIDVDSVKRTWIPQDQAAHDLVGT